MKGRAGEGLAPCPVDLVQNRSCPHGDHWGLQEMLISIQGRAHRPSSPRPRRTPVIYVHQKSTGPLFYLWLGSFVN